MACPLAVNHHSQRAGIRGAWDRGPRFLQHASGFSPLPSHSRTGFHALSWGITSSLFSQLPPSAPHPGSEISDQFGSNVLFQLFILPLVNVLSRPSLNCMLPFLAFNSPPALNPVHTSIWSPPFSLPNLFRPQQGTSPSDHTELFWSSMDMGHLSNLGWSVLALLCFVFAVRLQNSRDQTQHSPCEAHREALAWHRC